MFTNDSYALLIGVDDYSTYDTSRSEAVGTSDLKGSRNDAKTFWRLCRLIGIQPAHIRVLTSPPVDLGDLPGATPENVGPATEAKILEMTGWLADRLGQPSKPTGILTWSGHGDWLAGKGLVLCPSDVTWAPDESGKPGLAHTVSFGQLNKRLAPHAENLTVVLDTCHSGTANGGNAAKTGKPLGLTRRPIRSMPGLWPTGSVPELQELVGRVLAASNRNQVAYQSMFDGQYRGVFSWALSAAIEQWRATQEGSNVCIDLSYGKLIETTERLISALWFDQTPQLFGPPGIADLAVLHQGLAGHPDETATVPDGGFKTEQLDPGFRDYLIYTVTDAMSGAQVAQVLVTATAGGGYDADREYWYVTTNLSNSGSYVVTGGTSQSWSNPPSGLGTLSFKMQRTPTWTSGTLSGTLLAYSSSLTGEFDGINWAMDNSRGTWTGSITWWHNSTGNLFGDSVRRMVSSTALRNKPYYYYTSTPL
jgi:hypothetical protein